MNPEALHNAGSIGAWALIAVLIGFGIYWLMRKAAHHPEWFKLNVESRYESLLKKAKELKLTGPALDNWIQAQIDADTTSQLGTAYKVGSAAAKEIADKLRGEVADLSAQLAAKQAQLKFWDNEAKGQNPPPPPPA